MYRIVDANIITSEMSYLFSEICAIYPITPSSNMASNIDSMASKNIKNIFNVPVKVIEMQSEAGAAGAMHGALITGSLATTYTASQGLLLMLPNMYKMAGEMLPGVIHVAARSLSTHALSIFGDHQDVYATRATGFCILASSNVEDARAMALVAHLSTIKASLPFLHFFDGFRTSHEVNTIEDFNIEHIKSFIKRTIDYHSLNKFRSRALNVGNKVQKGLAQNEDVYFQMTEARNDAYNQAIDIVTDYMKKVGDLVGIKYKPFNYYGHKNATNIIVAMGSVCDTVKLVIDDLNEYGEKLGLIEVHLYRPFSIEHLIKEIPSTVVNIAVLDRTKEAGSYGEPLYLDVLNALKNSKINVVGGRYGLSSKNVSPSDIKSVFTMLKTRLKDNFTIGIKDDITNLSLKAEKYSIETPALEILIYGLGGDGMVSTSKNIISTINEKQKKYVQGYFQYDSKKSNGVTISNLRINNNKINMPYFIDKADLIVVSEDEYINKFNIVNKLEENGVLILNTSKTFEELNEFLLDRNKELINKKNVKILTIDATKIADDNKITGKINKIMEVIILKELNVEDYEDRVRESIRTIFKTKGQDIIDNNINALKEAVGNLKEIKGKFTLTDNLNNSKSNIFTIIENRNGDKLKVSDVYDYRDGTFIGGTSKYIKPKMNKKVSKWIKEKCIECMQCSFVCPHAAIRPFILDEKSEYIPLSKPMMGQDNKYFMICVSEADCTGCGHCITTCPTNALEFGEYNSDNQEISDNLFNNHKNPLIFDKYTIKGSQLRKPKFEFAPACAGCGETPYLRLLTQLFGNRLVIANATGCSSIYGGTLPNTPYSVPWASSLFEDNAEFGYGMYVSYQNMKERIKQIIKSTSSAVDTEVNDLYNKYLENENDLGITYKIKEELKTKDIPRELREIIDYIPHRSVWMIGGDGWAYDIGFSGIDHVLHSGSNVNILVLDTEVYSNTGGQLSKSSRPGQIAEFADLGKKNNKKDLFKYAMNIKDVYVASVCLGANPLSTIRAFKEAEEHNGPSIIIAYSPCVEHGIKGSLKNSLPHQKLAVDAGYLLLMRYNGKKLIIDSKEPDFEKYYDYLNNEVRYSALNIKDEKLAKELLEKNKQESIDRFNYYNNLTKKELE